MKLILRLILSVLSKILVIATSLARFPSCAEPCPQNEYLVDVLSKICSRVEDLVSVDDLSIEEQLKIMKCVCTNYRFIRSIAVCLFKLVSIHKQLESLNLLTKYIAMLNHSQ
ncbi:hypothetical protein BDZ91DRAFT_731286 [Kalaharituber pfeilii]|nr:hypothetical protein BDZ91DRAFT_731286 [Kalaharituber pfeilii]